jgi:hypothetical protein
MTAAHESAMLDTNVLLMATMFANGVRKIYTFTVAISINSMKSRW